MNSSTHSSLELVANDSEGPALDTVVAPRWSPLIVPITVASYAEEDPASQRLSVSIPLARGSLFAPCVASLTATKDKETQASSSPPQAPPSDSDSDSACSQTRILACWPDGSVRWLLVRLEPGLLAPGESRRNILLAPAAREPLSKTVLIKETPTGLGRIETDQLAIHCEQETLKFTLPDGSGSLTACLKLTDVQSQTHPVRFEKAEVEASGPVQTTLLLTGKVLCQAAGGQALNCQLRLFCFPGSSKIKTRVTLHNPRRAAHHSGLWDLGDEGSVFFRSWEFQLAIDSPSAETGDCVGWLVETRSDKVFRASNVEIYQDSSGGENWHSPVHVNRSGRVPCQFRGYRVAHENQQSAGLRATPAVGARGSKLQVAAAVEKFWQQFPLSISADSEGIKVGLFPSQWSDQFELQGGEQKTHDVWLEVTASKEDKPAGLDSRIRSVFETAHLPARAWCDPDWYIKTNAMPALPSREPEPPDSTYKMILEEALAGERSLNVKRETLDAYGWRNYGDVWADHEQAYYEGQEDVVSHYNNQFDMIAGGIRQFMRTGNLSWWSFAAPLARHVLDIDLYRTKRDRAAYNGGLFWFTDHYSSAATATHRTFSRHNAPVSKDGTQPKDYGGGPGSEHNFATGLLYYYWMTGDEDAAEGVRLLADWVLAMDDGGQTIWGMFDSGPTGIASMSGSLEYQGPGRGAANSVQVLLDGWLLTREHRYLEKCEALIRRVIHPDDAIPSLQLLNAERRWSYTMLLSALFRFLEIKVEEDQFDAAYAYAQASLVAYARWMALHERPYLDAPEELEFPTEAWSAQDLRKANVMRWAALVLEPLSAAEATLLRERGTAIADRAWQDLRNFKTRGTTRSVAIVMTEGSMDAYLRATAELPKLPLPATKYDFGTPENFIAQKIRLRSALRTPRGILHLLLTPFRPEAWRIFIRQIRKKGLK